MDYEKQTFVDGEVLTAEQLNHMERGIEKMAAIVSNPNLLDNWYFADPINQRGQPEYTSEQNIPYTIDRWRIGWNQTVTLTEKGVTITAVSGNCEFAQILDEEVSDFIEGREVTLSVLTVTGRLFESTGVVTNRVLNGNIMRVADWAGYPSVFLIFAQDLEPLLAAKLELGSQQTLARQENGVWVLNDPPPNKQQELAKCQRYYQKSFPYWLRPTAENASYACGSAVTIRNNCIATVPFVVEMRTTPTVTKIGKAFCFAALSDGTEADTYDEYIVPVYANSRGFGLQNGFYNGIASFGICWEATADL